MSEETADDLLDALILVEGSDEAGSPMSAAECVEALAESFPGFWWRGGTCALSSEVIIAPDYNDPEHGEQLLAEYPPELEHWNSGIEVELRPGSDAAFCRAFLAVMIRIKLAKLGLFPSEIYESSGRNLADATSNHTEESKGS